MPLYHQDRKDYLRFSGPMRVSKAMHTLQGLLQAFSFDGRVNDQEKTALEDWMKQHEPLEKKHPFSEVVPPIKQALSDGKLEQDEIEDILWLCKKLDADGSYYDGITADMQRLQGLISGIIADKQIDDKEIQQLKEWINENDQLKTCWPYDEIEALLLEITKDQVVTDDERKLLLAYLSEFSTLHDRNVVSMPLNETKITVTGLCAVCPELIFADRTFCFTGQSSRLTRQALAEIVKELGGKFHPIVTQTIDYLVIGGAGNPCWAYCCYGRKVEQAIKLRKAGNKLLLVHENDFWDGYHDAKK